jgi:hypothetical protein
MAPTLLRKRRQQNHSNTSQDPNHHTPLRHALSLPDLTTPLLDPSSWVELPSLFALPSIPAPKPNVDVHGATESYTPRGRKVSLVSQGSPVQFHRPFTPWHVVNTETTLETPAMSMGDFRTSRARWGRDSIATQGTGTSVGIGVGRGWRKRGKNKVMGRLNVVVMGARGVGKTRYDSGHRGDAVLTTVSSSCSLHRLEPTRGIPTKARLSMQFPHPQKTPNRSHTGLGQLSEFHRVRCM